MGKRTGVVFLDFKRAGDCSDPGVPGWDCAPLWGGFEKVSQPRRLTIFLSPRCWPSRNCSAFASAAVGPPSLAMIVCDGPGAISRARACDSVMIEASPEPD